MILFLNVLLSSSYHMSKKSTPQKSRVQIVMVDIPSPMSNKLLSRTLINPWRRTDSLDCVETQLPINQIWTQQHQQMFELQAIAKVRGEPDATKPEFVSPYPQ